MAHVQVGLVALEFAGAHLAEGDTRAVVGVDVCSDFKDEASKLSLVGLYGALLGFRGFGRRCYLHEAVEQFLYTEVVESRTEEHRCYLSRTVGGNIERWIDTVDEFQVVAQLLCILFADTLIKLSRTQFHTDFLRHALFVWCEEVEFVLVDVIDTLKLSPLVDRPGEGAYLDLQFLLQFVKQVEGVASLAVHLVDEDDDRCLTHATYLHEFARLCLHTLGTVDNDDSRVDGSQCAVGILGEVLVAWCVEDVHFVFYVRAIRCVVELHDRCRHRDTTLFLNVHPVAGGCLSDVIAFDRTSYLYLPSKEQEFLGERGLSGIWVADDGEGAAAFYFLVHYRVLLLSVLFWSVLIHSWRLSSQ